MPEQKTLKRAAADKRAGKSASTQAGEFVKEQVDKVRAGKHGVRSPKQAIAIGLSEARRAGVDLKPPKKGATSEATRKKAQKDSAAGKHEGAAKKSASKESSAKRSRVSESVLKRESKGRGVVGGDVEAGEVGGGQAASSEPLGRSQKGRCDEGRGWTLRCREKGRANAGVARASLSLRLAKRQQ
ncbi:hypothetical protein OKW36_001904 [Paraburkholderia sp. MM5482-R1]